MRIGTLAWDTSASFFLELRDGFFARGRGSREKFFSSVFLLIFCIGAVTIEAQIKTQEASPMEDYGADFISITDENGEEFELEVLATVTYKGAEYLALTPANASDEEEELEISILRSTEDENGEPVLAPCELTTRKCFAPSFFAVRAVSTTSV